MEGKCCEEVSVDGSCTSRAGDGDVGKHESQSLRLLQVDLPYPDLHREARLRAGCI